MNSETKLKQLVQLADNAALSQASIDEILCEARIIAEQLPLSTTHSLRLAFFEHLDMAVGDYEPAWAVLLASVAFEESCQDNRAFGLYCVLNRFINKWECVEHNNWGWFANSLLSCITKFDTAHRYYVVSTLIKIGGNELKHTSAVSVAPNVNIDVAASKIAQEIIKGKFCSDQEQICFKNEKGNVVSVHESAIEVPANDFSVLKAHLPSFEYSEIGLCCDDLYQYVCAKDEVLELPYTIIYADCQDDRKAVLVLGRDRKSALDKFYSAYEGRSVLTVACSDNAESVLSNYLAK